MTGRHDLRPRLALGVESLFLFQMNLEMHLASFKVGGVPVLRRAHCVALARDHSPWSSMFSLLKKVWIDVSTIRQINSYEDVIWYLSAGLVNPQGAIAALLRKKPMIWQIVDSRTPQLLHSVVFHSNGQTHGKCCDVQWREPC